MRLIIISATILIAGCDDGKDLHPGPNTKIKDQLEWQRTFYFNRIEEFKKRPIGKDKIVFLGNSLTKGGGDWSKRFNAENIVNRGISGDYTNGILKRLEEIIHYQPRAVFLMAGINEFWSDNSDRPYITPKHVAKNIITICKRIKEKSPETEIFIQTILPVNNQQYLDVKKVDYNFLLSDYSPTVNDQVRQTNSILMRNNEFTVINLYKLFLNDESILDTTMSSDGIHINEKGYQVWVNKIKPFVDRLDHQTI
jgi:lysophospholipase L1-like esterase